MKRFFQHHSFLTLRFIVCSTLLISCMPSHAMSLGNMPRDALEKIILHIIQSVGTPALINKKDISVIVKYLHALSLTNKNLYRSINNTLSTRTFIGALSERFKIDPLDAASQLDTAGAHEWIKNYIFKTDEYELFKAMHRVFEITHEVRRKFDTISLEIRTPKFNFYSNQTQQGMFITLDNTPESFNALPDFLTTPWGNIRFFKSKSGCKLDFIKFTHKLFKRLKTVYVHTIPEMFMQEIEEHARNEVPPVMSEEHNAAFKLHAVDGYHLPEPELADRCSKRSREMISVIWKILQERYEQEKGIDQENQSKAQKKRTYFKEPKSCFTSFHATARECVGLLAQLDAQPLFESQEPCAQKYKILNLEKQNDCRLVKLLCEGAKKYLGKSQVWHVTCFGTDQAQLCDANGESIGNAIAEEIIADHAKCSLGELQTVLTEMMHGLRTDWHQSTLIENQDIFHTESEEEWFLFIKPKRVPKENFIFNTLSCSLGVRHLAYCCDRWNKSEMENESRDVLYLWIEKKALNKVVEAMNLRLEMGKPLP